MRKLVMSSVVVMLAACGSDDIDLTGVYRVDSAVGSAPCGADAAITFAPFVKFEKMELFGQDFFGYDGCTDAAATDCSTIGGLFGGFFEPTDDGWTGQTSFSSGGGGGSCALGLAVQSATLRGDAMVIESFTYVDEVEGLSEEQCEPAEAERRGDTMPCMQHQLVDATRL